MYHGRSRSTLAAALVVCMLLTTTLALAESPYAQPENETRPDAGIMLVDLILLRPLGIIATVVGSAAFVVSLIFTLPTNSVDDAAQTLVVDPARYTFVRPFGRTEFTHDYR